MPSLVAGRRRRHSLSRLALHAVRASHRPVPNRKLPDDVLALLHERVTSLDELKALLLLHGDASRRWTTSAVAMELGLPESWSEPALESLCEAELLVGQGKGSERQFSYRPATDALGVAVSSLAEIYEARRVDVIRVLSSKAVSRIRWTAARTIAEALVIKWKGRWTKDG